ncbi:hypothetical protein HYE62_00740, partial [Aggregatibacter actinomycetemcomitans]|nr:hypothetical protein [Aggregatibacter actinomycetemcomitans]MBN6082775.1 hypothetical protein [Aggregatibacter actinomycetemcomitans]
DVVTQTGMFNDIQWALSPMDKIQDTFNFYEDPQNRGYTLAGTSFEQFASDLFRRHKERQYQGWFYILFPLFWFVLLALPKWRPVRIDS